MRRKIKEKIVKTSRELQKGKVLEKKLREWNRKKRIKAEENKNTGNRDLRGKLIMSYKLC